MNLLHERPASRHVDDGMKATYECQACYVTETYIMDPYDVPTSRRCTHCGYYEGDEQ